MGSLTFLRSFFNFYEFHKSNLEREIGERIDPMLFFLGIHDCLAVLFLGVFCSCICYLIFNYVLANMNTAVASNISASSATAIGVMSGVLLAGDPGGWFTVAGLALTISGLWLSGSR